MKVNLLCKSPLLFFLMDYLKKKKKGVLKEEPNDLSGSVVLANIACLFFSSV